MPVRVCRCCGAVVSDSMPPANYVHHVCEACLSLEDSHFHFEVPITRKVRPNVTVLKSVGEWFRLR